jgi:TorA maturation chaperone TorD
MAELEALARGLLDTGTWSPELTELLEADWGSLATEYRALFGGDCLCIFEGSYEPDAFRVTRELDGVAGFYRAFGADTGGSRGDRPDHVGTELEFLAYLAARRAAASTEEERELCRGAEDAFLAEHLGRWFPAFCRRAQECATGFYSALARLGERFITQELADRGIQPKYRNAP